MVRRHCNILSMHYKLLTIYNKWQKIHSNVLQVDNKCLGCIAKKLIMHKKLLEIHNKWKKIHSSETANKQVYSRLNDALWPHTEMGRMSFGDGNCQSVTMCGCHSC